MRDYLETQSTLVIELLDTSNLSKGYLIESVGENRLEVLEEGFKMKVAALGKKLWEQLKKIMDFFRKFLEKAGVQLDKITARGQACYKQLQEKPLTPEDADVLGRIVDKHKDAFPIFNRQPYPIVLPNVGSEICNSLAVALSDTIVLASTEGLWSKIKDRFAPGEKDESVTVSAEDINYVVNLMLSVENPVAVADGAINHIKSAWWKYRTTGIPISVDTVKIAATAKELDFLQKRVEAKRNKDLETIHRANLGVAGAAKHLDKASMALMKQYQLIIGLMTKSIRLYSGLNNYRSGVILDLERFLLGQKPAQFGTLNPEVIEEPQTDN